MIQRRLETVLDLEHTAIAEVMLQNDVKLGRVNKSEKAAKKEFSLDGVNGGLKLSNHGGIKLSTC